MSTTETQTVTDTKLARIAWLSRKESTKEFRCLMHHFNEESLKACYHQLDGSKAVGIDGVDKKSYGENLDGNLKKLIANMKQMSYRPGVIRQVSIPKEGKAGAVRNLGISNLEDKLVQKMMQRILESIYEPLFLDCSFGFRVQRSCHAAIKALHDHLSADMLNDRILPWYEEQGIPILRILTDWGSEYKGNIEHHAFELFLSIEGIEHTVTRAYSSQTNGMCERFNKTMKQEFFDTAMRKKIYTSLEDLQLDLDIWLEYYNHERPHSGKYCYGKTPMQTFQDSKKLAVEKNNEILYLEYISDSQNLTDNQVQNL